MTRHISRRIFGSATAAFAVQTGMSLLTSKGWSKSKAAEGLREALTLGESTAYAQSCVANSDKPWVVVEIMHAPKNAYDFIGYNPKTSFVGLATNAQLLAAYAGDTTLFPTMRLNTWIAAAMADISGKCSMSLMPCFKGDPNKATLGNHIMTDSSTGLALTGCTSSWITNASQAAMQVDFTTAATCNTAEGIIAAGNKALPSFTDIPTMVTAMTSAVTPLQQLPPASQSLRDFLNGLVTSDKSLANALACLGEDLGTVVPTLNGAAAASQAKPTLMQATDSSDVMKLDVMAANNAGLLQWQACLPLILKNVLHGVTLCFGAPDSNGGGDGGKLATGPFNDNSDLSKEVKAAQLINQIVKDINAAGGKVWIISRADGGRTCPQDGTTAGGDETVSQCLMVSNDTNAFANKNWNNDSASGFKADQPAMITVNGASVQANYNNMFEYVVTAAGYPSKQYPLPDGKV